MDVVYFSCVYGCSAFVLYLSTDTRACMYVCGLPVFIYVIGNDICKHWALSPHKHMGDIADRCKRPRKPRE